jgi:hypothetical protein
VLVVAGGGSGGAAKGLVSTTFAVSDTERPAHDPTGTDISVHDRLRPSIRPEGAPTRTPSASAPQGRSSHVQRSPMTSSMAVCPSPLTHSVIACDALSVIIGVSSIRTRLLPHPRRIDLFFVPIEHHYTPFAGQEEAKTVNLITTVIESLAEAVALVRKFGLDGPAFLDFLTGSLFAAPVYRIYGSMIAASLGVIPAEAGIQTC